MPTLKNASVAARWTLLPAVGLISSSIAFCAIALAAGLISGGPLYLAALPTAALIILICVGTAPSHKRVVAVSTSMVVAVLIVKFVPYPNIGLPFGYWTYPNRAIDAFLECPNVQSARLGWRNHDLNLEEFGIDVTFSDTNGHQTTRGISFPQYPSRKYIAGRVATIDCGMAPPTSGK